MQRKIISVSLNEEEFEKLEEIKIYYQDFLGLELNDSSLLKSIIFKYNTFLKENVDSLERKFK